MATRRRVRRVIAVTAKVVAVAIVVLLLVVAVTLGFLTRTEPGRALLLNQVLSVLNEQVFTGTLSVERIEGPVLGRLVVVGAEMVDAEGDRVAAIERAEARYRIAPLLRSELLMESLVVDGIEVRARLDEAGALNLADLVASSDEPQVDGAGFGVRLEEIVVRGGGASLRDGRNRDARLAVVSDLNVTGGLTITRTGALTLRLAEASAHAATPVDLDAPVGAAFGDAKVVFDRGRIGLSFRTLRLGATRLERFSGSVVLDPDSIAPFQRVDLGFPELELRPEDVAHYLGDTGLHAPLRISGQISGPVEDVVVDVPIEGPAGRVELQFRLDLRDPAVPAYRGLVRVVRFVPSEWVATDLDADISASVQFDGRGFNPRTLRTGLRLDFGPSHVQGIGIEGAFASARYEEGALSLSSLDVFGRQAGLRARGGLDVDGAIDLELNAEATDLALLLGPVAGDVDVAGGAEVELFVSGSLPMDALLAGEGPATPRGWLEVASGLAVSGSVRLTRAGYGSDVAVRRFEMAFVAEGGEELPDVSAEVGVQGLDVADQIIDSAVLRVGFRDGELRVAGEVDPDGDLEAALDVVGRLEDDRALVSLRRLDVGLGSLTARALPTTATVWLDEALRPTRVAWGETTVEVDSQILGFGGEYSMDGAVGLRASTLRVDLARIDSALGLDLGIEGDLTTTITVDGSLSAPALGADIEVAGLRYRDSAAVDLKVSATLADSVLRPRVEVMSAGETVVELEAGPGGVPVRLDLARGTVALADRPLEAALRLHGLKLRDAATFVPALADYGPSGTLSGTIDFGGTAESPALRWDVTLADAAVRVEGEDGPCTPPGSAGRARERTGRCSPWIGSVQPSRGLMHRPETRVPE